MVRLVSTFSGSNMTPVHKIAGVGDAHQAIQSNESRAEHTAQALDDPNRNRSASANSRPEFSPESNRLKRVRSAGTDEDETTHAPLPGTSTDPSSKRKTPSSRRKTPGSNRTKRGSKPKKNGVVYTEEGRRQFVERFCPGQVTTSGQRQCEDSQTPFKYKQKWEDSFDKCCMLSYKLEPPIGKMKYRCVFVCDRKFETRSKLRNHVWDDHMATTDFSSSSHTQNQMQTVNCINTSLARDENAVLHTSPQNALTMDNSSHNGINGTAFVDNTNSSGLLPGSSVPPGTTPPDASMGTYQAPDTDTYNSLDFNLDLDFSDIDAEAILALNPHATNV
jgi:hypothetical protein